MTIIRHLIACAVIAFAAVSGHAGDKVIFVEGFDTAGSNEGGWHYSGFDTWQSTGGNPGGYRRVDGLDTFAPQPRTSGSSLFTGNYRERNITSLGIDLRTFNNPTTGGRPTTLMLIRENVSAAYYLGPNIPSQAQGWVSYDYVVPSQSDTLPPGWQLLNMQDSGSPPQHSWSEILENVTQVRFFYGDPTMFFIFQMWNLGMDNARISWMEEPGCAFADLNCDGFVDVLDMLILLDDWGKCKDPDDCISDLNGDGQVNVLDLLILLDHWDEPPPR